MLHRYIKPGRPQQNRKVERSHGIDNEAFCNGQTFTTFTEAATALRARERCYKWERFSMALKRRTPAEKPVTFSLAASTPLTHMPHPGPRLDDGEHRMWRTMNWPTRYL